MFKLGIIDDSWMITDYFEKELKGCADITIWRELPSDTAELDEMDMLIVDGQGISNEKWNHGLKFLADYTPKNPSQGVMFYSGNSPDVRQMEMLKAKGFTWKVKGRDPYEVVEVVLETKAHKEKEG